jgi:hypothetical protein
MDCLRRRAASWTLAVLALIVCGLPSGGHAGENTSPRAGKHLRYQRSYAAALLEARIRNLPVLVSRHKDF